MVELNPREKTVRIKIVYYGPPVGGKTTNLRKLHEAASWARRGELVSINSAQDRTILFDLLPLGASGFRGFEVKIQLLAVPGQIMYAASRRVALKGTDGVVFVANSANDRFEDNTTSYAEMCRHLTTNLIDPNTVPMVMQYNKRDLPAVIEVEGLENGLNKRRAPAFPAIASRGEGVLETFTAVLQGAMRDLVRHFRTFEMPKGRTPDEWVAETIDGIFGGKRSLVAPAEAPAKPAASPQPTAERFESFYGPAEPGPYVPPEPPQRKVKIAMGGESAGPPQNAAQQAKFQESLVESYAEASAELGSVAATLRDERDLERARHGQIVRLVDIGDEITAGLDVVGSLGRALSCFCEAAKAQHASFLLPAPGAIYRALPRPPLSEDPLLAAEAGLHVLEALRDDAKPSVHRAVDSQDVAAALEEAPHNLGAVAVVPVRSPQRALGLALLYFSHDAPLPSASTLEQLHLLSRLLRAPLELAIERGVA